MPIIALLILLSQTLAISQKFPWQQMPGEAGRVIWLGFTAIFIWLLLMQPPKIMGALENGFRKLFESRAWLPGLAAFNLLIAVFNYLKFKHLGYGLPVPHAAVFMAAVWFLRRERFETSCVYNFGFLAASILVFPIDAARSDMLPVISEALNQWWSKNSPYSEFLIAGHSNRMPYLPGTLFSHLPAWALGIDLRWNELIYRALWMIPLICCVRKLPAGSIWIDICHFFVLSPYLNFRHELYFEFFMLLLMLYFVSPRGRWLIIPLLIATRQWSWVLAPFMVISELKRRRFVFGIQLLIGSVVVAAIMCSLLGRSTGFEQFVRATSYFQRNLEVTEFSQDHGLTLAPIFYWLKIAPYMQMVQAAMCVILFFHALRRPLEKLYCYASLTLILFLLLNCHFWQYFYISVVFWMISAQVAESGKWNCKLSSAADTSMRERTYP